MKFCTTSAVLSSVFLSELTIICMFVCECILFMFAWIQFVACFCVFIYRIIVYITIVHHKGWLV